MARQPKKPTPALHRASARRYRERMRAQGLRQVSLWLHDRSSPAFARECRRQSILASQAAVDVDLLLDGSAADIDGWTS